MQWLAASRGDAPGHDRRRRRKTVRLTIRANCSPARSRGARLELRGARAGRDRAAAGPGLRRRPARVPARGRRRGPGRPARAECAGRDDRDRRPRGRTRAAPRPPRAPRHPGRPARPTPRSRARAARARARAARAARLAAPDLSAPALVVHTSGTTGTPRPVELTLGQILRNALGVAAALGHDRAERWLCPLPLSHVGGLMVLLRSRHLRDDRGARARDARRTSRSPRSSRPSSGG